MDRFDYVAADREMSLVNRSGGIFSIIFKRAVRNAFPYARPSTPVTFSPASSFAK